jgi:PAS domain S-box-containing protein
MMMLHVLYVDDEPALLELGKIFLEQSGTMTVETATSARDALSMLEQNHYDAVVSDFEMRDIDGISFLKRIRAFSADLPFILFTGKGREEVVIEALNNGADFYLQKGGDPYTQFIELQYKIQLAVKRQQSDEKIRNFSRLYAMLNAVNTAILHRTAWDELLRDVCTIVVHEGKFERAWIGMINTRNDQVSPVACSGYKDEYQGPVAILADAACPDEQISGYAAHTKTRIIRNDLPRGAPGGRQVPGGRPGYRSTAAFPICLQDAVIGTLQIFAYEPHFFGEDEASLVDQVCSAIAFALETLRIEEQREKAEQALLESEEKFRILVEESLIGVYTIQGDRFLHVNPRFASIFGYTPGEIINTLKVKDIVAPESRDMVEGNLRMRLSGEIKNLHYAFRGLKKDGKSVDLEVAGTSAMFHGKPIVIGTLVDINERRLAEKDLMRTNRKLTLLNSLTRHDIANRLTVLRGRLNPIRRQTDDPILRQQLEKVDEAGRDIASHLETARIYQEIGIVSPQWQDVRECIEKELERGRTDPVHVTLSVTGLEIYADPLVNRVFANLIDNTLHHGGHATEIRVSFEKTSDGVTIIWTDNGVGIPADLKEQVFEQGFGSNTGPGLGLFLCREIFSSTGIGIRETGVPGKGVRFEIVVPVAASRIAGNNPMSPAVHRTGTSDIRS